ncbi:uncharacterized protein [Ptychodera flava]|uniref:uncharacterized protein n=1 Tax=Ptychodera flava TaxID=63121 RepID=UPI00396A7D49
MWAESDGSFSMVYYPTFGEYGVFSVDARHPGDVDDFQATMSWTVSAMAVIPSFVTYQRDISDGYFSNVATLHNIGPDDLFDIQVQVDKHGLPIDSVDVFPCGQNATSNLFLNSLRTQTEKSVCVNITASSPFDGSVDIMFSSSNGTSTTLEFNLEFKSREAVFVISPSSFEARVQLGTQQVYQFVLSNYGDETLEDVQVHLPENTTALSIVSLHSDDSTSEGAVSIAAGSSATLILLLSPSPDATLSEFRGLIRITAGQTEITMEYVVFITESSEFDLIIDIKDEYSYFHSEKPLVEGAVFTLTNPQEELEYSAVSNSSGRVVIFNVSATVYTLRVSSPDHAPYSRTIGVSWQTSREPVTIFLIRTPVKYSWTVTQTVPQKDYSISMEPTYEADVAMPVVVIEPAVVDLSVYEQSENDDDYIPFKITNYGNITAKSVDLILPTGHPTLDFVKPENFPATHLPGNTTMTLQVNLRRKNRRRRQVSDTACYTGRLDYHYETDAPKKISFRVYYVRSTLDCIPESNPADDTDTTLTPGSQLYIPIEYNPTTYIHCDCAEAVADVCVRQELPTPLSCMPADSIWSESLLVYTDSVMRCAGDVIGGKQLEDDPEKLDKLKALWTTAGCLWESADTCGQREPDKNQDVAMNLLDSSRALQNYHELTVEIFGSDQVLFLTSNTWYSTFKLAIDDLSDDGRLLTTGEAMTVMNAALNQNDEQETIREFILRWNTTVNSWSNGVYEGNNESDIISYSTSKNLALMHDKYTEESKIDGYNDPFGRFDSMFRDYVEANQMEVTRGCAKVQFQVQESVVFTRDVFHIKIIIENYESVQLTGIDLQLKIWRHGDLDQEDMTQHFSISDPNLVGITSIDGNGTLQMNSSASIEWSVGVLRSTAEMTSMVYAVGGNLTYNLSDTMWTVSLLPDLITIRPDYRLYVHYFMTQEITVYESTSEQEYMPFNLAVLIKNDGYDDAKNLKISSSRPEILSKENMQLIQFEIVSTMVGAELTVPSFVISFGDLQSRDAVTALWWLSANETGIFANFSATFENDDEMGNSEVSTIELIERHDLVHLVKIDISEDDDDLPDFLVNDVEDENHHPDYLYSSDTGTRQTVNLLETATSDIKHEQMSEYEIVTISTNLQEQTGWTYTSFEIPESIANKTMALVSRRWA